MTRPGTQTMECVEPMKTLVARRSGWLLLAPVLLAGCAGSNFEPESATAVVVSTGLGNPSIADMLPPIVTDTIVGPGDRMEFKVFGITELDRTVRVDNNGRVSLPLIGEVPASGRPLAELRNDIESRLRARYLQNPSVSLEVIESLSQRFVVDGGVRNPGLFPVVGNQTLMQAIAQANGLIETARPREVVVFRTINGVQHVAHFDLNAIRGGRASDPRVFANDRIIVGNDTSRALIRELISLTPLAGVFYQVFR